jgi:hypothetical protein
MNADEKQDVPTKCITDIWHRIVRYATHAFVNLSAFIGVYRRQNSVLQLEISSGARVATAAALGMPTLAFAHAFEERYDLPAPLSYFVTGAAAVVILSFVVAQVVVEHTPGTASRRDRIVNLGP